MADDTTPEATGQDNEGRAHEGRAHEGRAHEGQAHEADRPPTAEEEAAAPTEVDPATREAFSDMAEIGANAEGEGRIP